RPIYTWPHGYPPVEAMSPLQNYGGILVVFGALAAVSRVILQASSFGNTDVAARALRLQAALPTRSPQAEQAISPMALVVGKAAVSTFLLAGLLESWLDAFFLCGALLLVGGVQHKVVSRWGEWVS